MSDDGSLIVLPKELVDLKRFHGHLGPYVVMGYRMGRMARERYPRKIHAIVYCGSQRPRSCLADGIQFSSCCTLGKNNIEIVEDGKLTAIFTDGITAMDVSILPQVIESMDGRMTRMSEEELSLEIFLMKDAELLKIGT